MSELDDLLEAVEVTHAGYGRWPQLVKDASAELADLRVKALLPEALKDALVQVSNERDELRRVYKLADDDIERLKAERDQLKARVAQRSARCETCGSALVGCKDVTSSPQCLDCGSFDIRFPQP